MRTTTARLVPPQPGLCSICMAPLHPIFDREDYRFARCLECGRVYLVGEALAAIVVRNPRPHASQLHS